jgi:CheY-like chemotaxis protein
MAATRPHRKTKTILVVDDEAGVRGFVSLILRKGGYAVLEAEDSESAADTHRRHHGQIDLLLTDVFLPGRSGCDLAATLRESEPDLQVMFMSALPDVEECVPLLRKPFGIDELLHQVKRLVE